MSPPPQRYALPSDDDLPTYSIIVALYREAASVARLTRALEEIDYPSEKLEIKIVLEPDDLETRAALERLALRPEFDILLAPAAGPRTKPKALNAALPFITGSFVVVYDAEDRPERDQLRKAVAAFSASSRNLACVQARLVIDNTADGWLAGFFTAEYAAQFDIFLPALAALRVPLPLGGTSNHLRVDVLRKAGGWDSFNVTEDADLGIRLARLGYRADVIDSATYEEAPNRPRAWLHQRTRWFKGWMQTWMVHMRHPLRLGREIGIFSLVVFQLIVGGTVLAALIHTVFLITVLHALLVDNWIIEDSNIFTALSIGLFSTAAIIGYFGSISLGWAGLARHKLTATTWVLLLTPLHWLMLSYAAWRALIQLIHAPYHWEKTEHGLARTSRQVGDASSIRARLIRLERHLSRITASEPARSFAPRVRLLQK
jgi:cellulose synthase/poly-beta-1,6-N-acetylglucosamine synthase-like glycosyltransferase